MKNIKVKDGEMICDKCNGNGSYITLKNDRFVFVDRCEKCNGTGKLDWIDNVLGGKSIRTSFLKPGVYIKEVDLSGYVNFGVDYGENEFNIK